MSRVDLYLYLIEILFSTDVFENIDGNESPSVFNFRKGDFTGLNTHLNSVDWDQLLSNVSDIDDLVNIFYDKLLDGLDKFVPLKKIVTINDRSWYNQRLRNLKNRTNQGS